MRFWVRSAIGVGLFVASVLVSNLKLVALLNTPIHRRRCERLDGG